jgi:hypothetical protein
MDVSVNTNKIAFPCGKVILLVSTVTFGKVIIS